MYTLGADNRPYYNGQLVDWNDPLFQAFLGTPAGRELAAQAQQQNSSQNNLRNPYGTPVVAGYPSADPGDYGAIPNAVYDELIGQNTSDEQLQLQRLQEDYSRFTNLTGAEQADFLANDTRTNALSRRGINRTFAGQGRFYSGERTDTLGANEDQRQYELRQRARAIEEALTGARIGYQRSAADVQSRFERERTQLQRQKAGANLGNLYGASNISASRYYETY